MGIFHTSPVDGNKSSAGSGRQQLVEQRWAVLHAECEKWWWNHPTMHQCPNGFVLHWHCFDWLVGISSQSWSSLCWLMEHVLQEDEMSDWWKTHHQDRVQCIWCHRGRGWPWSSSVNQRLADVTAGEKEWDEKDHRSIFQERRPRTYPSHNTKPHLKLRVLQEFCHQNPGQVGTKEKQRHVLECSQRQSPKFPSADPAAAVRNAMGDLAYASAIETFIYR